MTTLSPRDGYRLWAPTYSAETVVTALEEQTVESFAVPVVGARLLDAGCGTGRRLRTADARVAVGIDLTPEMLPVTHRTEHYAVADVRALPFAPDRFDVVWCRLALGHIPDLAAAYRELARVCRVGGSVVVTDFHPAAAAAGHRRTFRASDGSVYEIAHYVHALIEHERAADVAGLDTIKHDDRAVGPAVREFYERAGRGGAYETQVGLPMVLGIAFTRRT